MKITVIIYAILIAPVASSFFDVFQGAVLSVQNSFGKLLSDVVTDVKETVDCTLLAVEHVLALSDDATTRYYNKCGSGTNNNPTPNDVKPTEKPVQKINITLEFVNDNNKQEDIKNEAPSDIGAKINETVVQLLSNYNAQDKLYSVSNVLAKETKQIVNVSDEIKNQLEKFSKVNISVLNTTSQILSKPSINTALHKLKILEKREQETNNASESSQIHKIINQILAKLEIVGVTEVTENEKIEKILIDLERETNNSFTDLRKEFEEWKREETLHLGEIKNNIEEREQFTNHTQSVINKALLSDENMMVNNTFQNYSSNANVSLTSAEISNGSLIINTTDEKMTNNTPLVVTILTSVSNKLNNSEIIVNNTLTTRAPNANVTIVNNTLHLKSDKEAKYLNLKISNPATIYNDTNYNATDSVTFTHLENKNIGNLRGSKYSIENIKDPPIEKSSQIISNQTKLDTIDDTIDTFSNSNRKISENSTIPSVDYTGNVDIELNRTTNDLNKTSALHNSTNSLQTIELNTENSAARDGSQLNIQEQAIQTSNETTQGLTERYLQINITTARTLNDMQIIDNFTSNLNENKNLIKNSTELKHENIDYSEIMNKNNSTLNDLDVLANSNETLNSVKNIRNLLNNFTLNKNLNKTLTNDTLLSVLTKPTTVPTLIKTDTSSNLVQNTTVHESSQIINAVKTFDSNVTSKDVITLKTNNERNEENTTLKSALSTPYLSCNNNTTVINGINNTDTRDYQFDITESERASSYKTVNNLTDMINHTNIRDTNNITEYPKSLQTITESESLTLKTNHGSIELKYENVITTSKINTLQKKENASIIITDTKLTSDTYTNLPVRNVLSEVISSSNNSGPFNIKESLPSTQYLINNTNDDRLIISSTDKSLSDTEIVNMPYTATSLPVGISKNLRTEKLNVEPTTVSIILNATITIPFNDTTHSKGPEPYSVIPNNQTTENVSTANTNAAKDVVNSINNVKYYVAQKSNNTVTNHNSNSRSHESVSVSSNITSHESEISFNTNSSSIVSSQSNHRENTLDKIINNAMLNSEDQKAQNSKQMLAKTVKSMPDSESKVIINDVSTSESVASAITTETKAQSTPVLSNMDLRMKKPNIPNVLPLNTGTIKELDAVATPSTPSLFAKKSYPILDADHKLPQLNSLPAKKLNQLNDFFSGSSSTGLRQSAGNSLESLDNNSNLQAGGSLIKNSHENTFGRAADTLLRTENLEKEMKNDQFQNRNSHTPSPTLLSKELFNNNLQPQLSSASNSFHNPPIREIRGTFTTPKSALKELLHKSQDSKQYHQHYQSPSELQAHQQAVRDAQRLITNTREQNRVLSNIRRHKNRAKSVFNQQVSLNAR